MISFAREFGDKFETQATAVIDRMGCGAGAGAGGGVVPVGEEVGVEVGVEMGVGVFSVVPAAGAVVVALPPSGAAGGVDVVAAGGCEPGLYAVVEVVTVAVPVGLSAAAGAYWMVCVAVVVFPAASVAVTVTAFAPGLSATVALHVPSAPTVVFTPFTVTEDPGSALPETTVFDPVTVAPPKAFTSSRGAAVSFTIVTFAGKEKRNPAFAARRMKTVVPSPT